MIFGILEPGGSLSSVIRAQAIGEAESNSKAATVGHNPYIYSPTLRSAMILASTCCLAMHASSGGNWRSKVMHLIYMFMQIITHGNFSTRHFRSMVCTCTCK